MTQRSLPLAALAALALAACQRSDDSNIAIDDGVNAAEAAEADVETLPPSESSAPLDGNSSSELNQTNDAVSDSPSP